MCPTTTSPTTAEGTPVNYNTVNDTTDSGSAELLGSLTQLTDPTSEIAKLLDLGSAFVRFSEILARFLPM
jgi:hypothetical protein